MSYWTWENPDWPHFYWSESLVNKELLQARLKLGKLLGLMQSFTKEQQLQIQCETLINETVDNAAIEGEILNRQSVRSSIIEKLGLADGGLVRQDRYIDNVVEIVLDATTNYQDLITLERLNSWQAALFPTGYSGIKKINVGKLRDSGTMEIISGRPGKTQTHFIAPPVELLAEEVDIFLKWLNSDSKSLDGLLRAAIAHLWFEILHPYDDGNGRVGRALLENCLANDEQQALRYFSVISTIMQNRKDYYRQLELHSRGKLDITEWLLWFLKIYSLAIAESMKKLDLINEKALFWQNHNETELSLRQRKALNKLLDIGKNNFEGGMTTKKYMHLTKCSRATASRELLDLVQKDCLQKIENTSGRNTAYELK